ncbi:CpaE family protein, partial [Nocardioides sp.]|uniref:AAA family ATPase n=1 Tax=Nocardioides sp. TaxID=35761 RepID=UPI00345D0B45
VREGAGDPEQAWSEALHDEPDSGEPGTVPGRVVAVWGPAGAPGRSTVATTLAATLAARRRRTVLVDVDPWGGSVAQQLGVLDEVSGLLAAARLASGGVLAERFPTVLRSLGQHLELLTGLPRADRWPEVRDGVVEEVLDLARQRGHVVVDTGAPLERDAAVDLAGRPGRNGTTLAALAEADELVVVGTADPVGLSRLARGLVELAEETGGRPVHLAVNRMRASLGWSAGDVEQMVRGFAEIASTTFLPEDQAATDRALVAGRSVVEVGDGPLAEAVCRLADAVLGADAADATAGAPRRTRRGAGGPQVRLRRAGTTRRR